MLAELVVAAALVKEMSGAVITSDMLAHVGRYFKIFIYKFAKYKTNSLCIYLLTIKMCVLFN
jgi:hypothetical protein